MKQSIQKHALKNALDFQGKVNQNVILGLVLREHPELKKDVPKLIQEIQKTISEVEKLTKEQIKKKLKELAPALLKEEKEETIEGPLKSLPNAVKGKVIVRIAPSPSGPLHIGHAYGASLNYEYAKMYNGKLILRIEDTNPENIYEPAYDLIEQDIKWITDNGISQVVIQSSRLGIYYDYAEKLIQKDKAYICTCNADQWREQKNQSIPCLCRKLPAKEHLLRYAKMFNEYAEGEAVVRAKTDIAHKNPAMRDFGLMRIIEHTHPKTGKEQRVWPLMVLAVAIDDHELGITHVLNGKDQADNAVKEQWIMKWLGWNPPEYKHWGIINFQGFEISKSKTKLAIEQGQYKGWDDIRLPFLPALRKRGYQAGAFHRFAIEIGLSLNDKTVEIAEFWKSINAFNKEIIEPRANRYFFVDNPTKIIIEGAPAKTVELNLHPDFPKRGIRKLNAHQQLFIAMSDKKNLVEGKIHRLMDYCNFQIINKKCKFLSKDYEEYKNADNKGVIMHWLPIQQLPEVEVVLEDGTTTKGYGEEALQCLKAGTIVQLERRYFARIDSTSKNKVTLWYLHR